MKKPDRLNIVVMLLMTFCLGLILPILVELLGSGNLSNPLDKSIVYLLEGLIISLFIGIPLFCYTFLKNHKFTIERKTKDLMT